MSDLIGHFSLWGDFEVEEITALMAMPPSAVYLKGEVLEGASAPASVSTWDLYCPEEKGGSMQQQIETLIGILSPKRDVVAEFSSKYKAALNVSISCSDGSEIMSLSRETLRRLVELNLEVNCFYTCNEEQDAD
jgi:hypothetical protein